MKRAAKFVHDPFILPSWLRSETGYASVTLPTSSTTSLDDDAEEDDDDDDEDEEDDEGWSE